MARRGRNHRTLTIEQELDCELRRAIVLLSAPLAISVLSILWFENVVSRVDALHGLAEQIAGPFIIATLAIALLSFIVGGCMAIRTFRKAHRLGL